MPPFKNMEEYQKWKAERLAQLARNAAEKPRSGPSAFCVKCGKQLPPSSTYCGYCGVNQATLATVPPIKRPFSLKKFLFGDKPMAPSGMIWAFTKLGFLSLVVYDMAWSCVHSGSPPTGQSDESAIKLRVMRHCEDHLREHLKSPSTAEFSSYYDTEVIDQGAGRYAAIGWVDSQNSFGAKLRTKYMCRVTQEANGQWRFEPLVVNDGSEWASAAPLDAMLRAEIPFSGESEGTRLAA